MALIQPKQINPGPAGGDLGGSYPNPTVVAIEETGDPQRLAIGAIPAGTILSRSGTSIVGIAAVFPTSSTWAVVLANGNVSGGTNPTLTTGDSLRGTATGSVAAAVVSLDAGIASVQGGTATTLAGAGGGVAVIAGNANAAGNGTGGAVTVTGGSGGATGVASSVTLTGGAGGATGGDPAGVSLQGGTPVDGNGGGLPLPARAGRATHPQRGGNKG